MKCSKCGYEFKEGRSCPKCGENAILVHEDYFKRRKEWEEKNTPKEEKEEKKPILTPELKKKIGIVLCAAMVMIVVVCSVIYLVKEYARTHKYPIRFGTKDGWIYTVNGAFAYEIPDAFSGINLEANEKFCSENGKVVAMTAYDAVASKYILYVSAENQSYVAYETENPIFIGQVGNNQKVLLLEMEYGEYGSVTSSKAIEISDSVKILAEEATFVETGKDDSYGIRTQNQLIIFEGNNRKNFAVSEAEKIVITENGIYYLQQGNLYDDAHEIVDEDVLEIFHVYGTNELLYCKNQEMILLENSGRAIRFPFENQMDVKAIKVLLRRGTLIYGWSQSDSIELHCMNRKLLSGKEGRPYLCVK